LAISFKSFWLSGARLHPKKNWLKTSKKMAKKALLNILELPRGCGIGEPILGLQVPISLELEGRHGILQGFEEILDYSVNSMRLIFNYQF